MCRFIEAIGSISRESAINFAMAAKNGLSWTGEPPADGWGAGCRGAETELEAIKSIGTLWDEAGCLERTMPSDMEFLAIYARCKTKGKETSLDQTQPYGERKEVVVRRGGKEKTIKRWSSENLERWCILTNLTVKGKMRFGHRPEGKSGAWVVENELRSRLARAEKEGLNTEEAFISFCQVLERRLPRDEDSKITSLIFGLVDWQEKRIYAYRGPVEDTEKYPDASRFYFAVAEQNGERVILVSHLKIPGFDWIELGKSQVVILDLNDEPRIIDIGIFQGKQ